MKNEDCLLARLKTVETFLVRTNYNCYNFIIFGDQRQPKIISKVFASKLGLLSGTTCIERLNELREFGRQLTCREDGGGTSIYIFLQHIKCFNLGCLDNTHRLRTQYGVNYYLPDIVEILVILLMQYVFVDNNVRGCRCGD